MRTLLNRLISASLLSFFLIAGTALKASAQDVTVSYQSFYDNLSPYGQWISDPQYGNVWVPNEDGDFRPYGSRGHWVMTDYGNTWVSDDPWGWACYHYGRWTYNPYYGWVWIPGYEWAPAWVSWRYGGGQCGWAPLGPGYSSGVGYNCPDNWWVFVGPEYMYRPDCFHYWRGPSYNTGYIRQTTIVNNYYVDNGTHVRYNYGPRADVIQRDTHQPVQVYRISQVNRPGAPNVGRNTVSLYRPAVNRSTVTQARPSNVVQAPRAIGKPQPTGNTMTGNRQPAFRQQIQQHPAPGNTGVVGPRNGPQQQGGRPQQGGNNAPQQQGPRNNPPQQTGRPQQPGNNNPQQQGPRNNPQQAPRQQQAPQQQAPRQQQQAPRPQQAPQQQQRPQPALQAPRQQQPPRQQPMQQQAPRPMPQQAPRPQPMQQQAPRQQPMPQQQAPRPMQQAPHEEPHEGGRR